MFLSTNFLQLRVLTTSLGTKYSWAHAKETALRAQKVSSRDFLITTPLQGTNSRFRQRFVVEPHIPGGFVECDIKQFSVGIDVD
jgi:hypothetical protein